MFNELKRRSNYTKTSEILLWIEFNPGHVKSNAHSGGMNLVYCTLPLNRALIGYKTNSSLAPLPAAQRLALWNANPLPLHSLQSKRTSRIEVWKSCEFATLWWWPDLNILSQRTSALFNFNFKPHNPPPDDHTTANHNPAVSNFHQRLLTPTFFCPDRGPHHNSSPYD